LELTKFYKDPNSVEGHFLPFLNPSDVEHHTHLYQFIEVLLQFQSQIYAKIKGASIIKKLDKPD
jgi:hypothetical protein